MSVRVEMYSGILENIQFTSSNDPLVGNHDRIFFKTRDGHLGRKNKKLESFMVAAPLTMTQLMRLTILLGQADGVAFGDGMYNIANVVRGFHVAEF